MGMVWRSGVFMGEDLKLEISDLRVTEGEGENPNRAI
jgi:hypothetical protein